MLLTNDANQNNFFHLNSCSCLNFWNETWWFLSFRVFGLFFSSLLLYSQRFGRYVLLPYSGVSCRTLKSTGTVGWGSRVHRLHLCWGVKLVQWVSWYDTKQSDGGALIIPELRGMRSTPSLSSLTASLWSRGVIPYIVICMGWIQLNSVFMLNWIVWNRTVFTFKLCIYDKLFIFIKIDLAINNLR